MLRLFKPLFLALLFSINVVIAESGHNFMWKVTSDTNELYLLGSIHALKDGMYPLNKNITKAYEKSDVLAVELDMSKVPQSAIMGLMTTCMYKGEDSLEKHISADVYSELKKVMAKLGFPEASYSKMKPWWLLMSITEVSMRKLGVDPKNGIDLYFCQRAALDKTPVVELEGFTMQLEIFKEISKKYPNEFVKFMIEDSENMEEQFDLMAKSWKNGNHEKLNEIFSELDADKDLKKITKLLMHDRNEGMVEKVKSYIKSGKKYFVVVGAGHLVGKTGLVEQMKKSGYKVEQVGK